MKNRIFILWVIGAALIVFGCAQEDDLVSPQLSTANTLAKHQPEDGYLLVFGEVGSAPSAIANNGDEINISASGGSFSFHPKTVSDLGGDFTITSAAGVYTGTWTATRLISFKSYGSTNGLFGGILILEIDLDGTSGILKLMCADFGNPPPGAVSGMTLQIAGGQNFKAVWIFDTECNCNLGPTHGFTLFLEN